MCCRAQWVQKLIHPETGPGFPSSEVGLPILTPEGGGGMSRGTIGNPHEPRRTGVPAEQES